MGQVTFIRSLVQDKWLKNKFAERWHLMIFYKVSELEGSVSYFRINSTIFHRTPTCTVFINFLFYFFILSVSFIFEYIYFYIFFHFRNYSFYTFLSNCRSSYLVSNQFIYFLIYVLHFVKQNKFYLWNKSENVRTHASEMYQFSS